MTFEQRRRGRGRAGGPPGSTSPQGQRPVSALPAREARTRRRLGRAALVAALLHVQLLLLVVLAVHELAPRALELSASAPLEVIAIDEQTARELLADVDDQKKPPEVPKADQEKRRDRAGQVVELPRPANETPPKAARFVAERDSTVARETRKLGRLDERATSGGAEAARPSSMMAMRKPARRGAPEEPTPTAPAVESPPATEESPEGLMPRLGHLAPMPMRRPSRNGAPSIEALVPSGEQIARAVGSGTQDHLADVDDGKETALNARAWRFASFFNRVKRQVRENWRAADEYQKRDPTGAIYGGGERSTLLRISLKPDGSLAGVNVLRPSGVEFLDDVAIEAVKRAQPFANPPHQLVDGEGSINFRFGFFFDVGGAPKMRVFRYTSM